jgi:hypothetical protein
MHWQLCQHPLRARYAAPAVETNSLAQCYTERLEARFGLVVVIAALQHIDVQRDARSRRERLKHVRDHLR